VWAWCGQGVDRVWTPLGFRKNSSGLVHVMVHANAHL
jgi:hypothetical protein